MAVDDIYSVNIVTELNGVALSNTLLYKELEAPSVTNILDVWEAWKADVAPPWNNVTSNEGVITCAVVKRLFPTEGPAFTAFENIPGNEADDPLPSNAHIPISLYSKIEGAPDRVIRNGILKSAIPENMVEAGQLTPSSFVQWNTLQDQLFANITSPNNGVYGPQVRGRTPPPLVYESVLHVNFTYRVRVSRRRTTNLCQTA